MQKVSFHQWEPGKGPAKEPARPSCYVCDRQYLLQLPWIPEIYDCLTAGRFVSTPRSLWGQRFSALEKEEGLVELVGLVEGVEPVPHGSSLLLPWS